jgi:hypothetical protein
MPQPEPVPGEARNRPDLPAWAALAWAVAFGVLYGLMVVQQKMPGCYRSLGRLGRYLFASAGL